MVSRVYTENFIAKANVKHGYRYDYSLVEYLRSSSPVKIKCPIHGQFEQMPRNHLRGTGCPFCAAESQEERGSTVGIVKRKQAEASRFFPPGTMLRLPFWDAVPEQVPE